MTTSHLVTRLNATLNGQINFGHLENARSQIVTRGDLRFLLVETTVEIFALTLQTLKCRLQLLVRIVILQSNFEPLFARNLVEVRFCDLAA